MKILRLILLSVVGFVLAAAGFAGNIVVVSPTNGQVLGATNTITFNITGAITAVTVSYVLKGPNGVQLSNNQQFTNIVDGKINGTLPLNLDQSLPDGAYTLQVTATEAGNQYNVPPLINLTIQLTAPKFLDFNPVSGAFVKGIVPISATIKTPLMKDYKVQIDGQDIPNNTGSTTTFVVKWDTSPLQTDGPHTINITIRDQALNTASQSISVTVDRLPPSVTVTYPLSSTRLLPHSTVSVVIDISDSSAQSVAVTGVDVIAKTSDGKTTLFRVPRVSFTGTRWTGRIASYVTLPSNFRLYVDCVDRAGNRAAEQVVNLTVG